MDNQKQIVIKYDIGKGTTLIRTGIPNPETDTPVIVFTQLRKEYPIGEGEIAEEDELGSVALFIHNIEGLEVLERAVKRVRKIFEETENVGQM